MYRFYRENGTWSYPVNKAYLEDYYRKNCADYGSEFEDWFADMLRNDLIRRIWRQDNMSEYLKAKEELRKAYQTDDWDYILCCQIDLMLAKRNYWQDEMQYGNCNDGIEEHD